MNTKIVYCLVSNDQDYFYEQLLISVCSLRKHNPHAFVEVICDYDTCNTLQGNRGGIYAYDVHIKTVETPKNWNNWEKSRYIKTNIRRLTQGDFLFIDTDTIVCSELEFIDNIDCPIAAVIENHVERLLPEYSKCRYNTEHWIWRAAKKANVDIKGLRHFNSGVMYVKDTEVAHRLYSIWAEKYSELLNYGVAIDQLSLVLANFEMNNIISYLDPKVNCQVVTAEGRNMLPDAKVIHYFPNQKRTLLSSPWIMDPIKETGRINAVVQRIIDSPYTFFDKESRIVFGDITTLVSSPLVLDAYSHFPRAFFSLSKILEIICRIRRKCNKLIGFFSFDK